MILIICNDHCCVFSFRCKPWIRDGSDFFQQLDIYLKIPRASNLNPRWFYCSRIQVYKLAKWQKASSSQAQQSRFTGHRLSGPLCCLEGKNVILIRINLKTESKVLSPPYPIFQLTCLADSSRDADSAWPICCTILQRAPSLFCSRVKGWSNSWMVPLSRTLKIDKCPLHQ